MKREEREKTEEKEKRKDKKLVYFLIIGIIIVIFVWFGLSGWIINTYGKDAGTFGDAFGAVNALFSALAFSFLIFTSLMQKRELEYQRRELKLTREAYEANVEINTEHLKLEKEATRHIFTPKLELDQVAPFSSSGSSGLKLRFYVVNNSLSITNFFFNNNENFLTWSSQNRGVMDRDQVVEIILKSTKTQYSHSETITTNNLGIMIQFESDQIFYRHILQFDEGGKPSIDKPRRFTELELQKWKLTSL